MGNDVKLSYLLSQAHIPPETTFALARGLLLSTYAPRGGWGRGGGGGGGGASLRSISVAYYMQKGVREDVKIHNFLLQPKCCSIHHIL